MQTRSKIIFYYKLTAKKLLNNFNFSFVTNSSFFTFLALLFAYLLAIVPLKLDVEKVTQDITDLQSDIIEARTILNSKEYTNITKYFSLPKGPALINLIKTTLEKFELQDSILTVKENSEFLILVDIQNCDYQKFKIWLDFLRKQYALVPIEIDIKKIYPSVNEVSGNRYLKEQTNLMVKISLKLKGTRF